MYYISYRRRFWNKAMGNTNYFNEIFNNKLTALSVNTRALMNYCQYSRCTTILYFWIQFIRLILKLIQQYYKLKTWMIYSRRSGTVWYLMLLIAPTLLMVKVLTYTAYIVFAFKFLISVLLSLGGTIISSHLQMYRIINIENIKHMPKYIDIVYMFEIHFLQ